MKKKISNKKEDIFTVGSIVNLHDDLHRDYINDIFTVVDIVKHPLYCDYVLVLDRNVSVNPDFIFQPDDHMNLLHPNNAVLNKEEERKRKIKIINHE